MNAIGSYCGIDPGQAGGIALIDKDEIVLTFDMPKTESEIAELFETRIACARICFCLIEKIGARPKQSAVAMATFMRHAGFLIGSLYAHHIPFQEIRPQDWQKAIGISPRRKIPAKPKPGKYYPPEESKTEFKRRLMNHARAMFPRVAVSLKTADALLIAEVARRVRY